MDEEILKSKNVEPRNKRVAIANGYELRIGKMATLIRKDKAKSHGLVYSLTHDEIDILYAQSGLTAYVTESLMVKLKDGSSIAALTCNLLHPPTDGESNDEYLEKLIKCMKNYELELPQYNKFEEPRLIHGEKMFETKFCKIDYIENINAILCSWKEFCSLNEYREPLNYGLKLINEKNATIWITDTTNGFQSIQEDNLWLATEFSPQALNSTCKKIIFIIKDDSPIKAEIEIHSQLLKQFFEVELVKRLEDIKDVDSFK